MRSPATLDYTVLVPAVCSDDPIIAVLSGIADESPIWTSRPALDVLPRLFLFLLCTGNLLFSRDEVRFFPF
jgi:hypothetical protein